MLFDEGVIGMPHIFDSVALTCVSPGAHIAAFCSGVNDVVMFLGLGPYQRSYIVLILLVLDLQQGCPL